MKGSLWRVLVLLLIVKTCHGEEDLVHMLEASLVQSFYHSTSYNELVEVYLDDARDAEVISPNGSLVTQQLADDLMKNIELIKSTLQSTVMEAEELYAFHSNTGCCCSIECDRTSSSFDQNTCVDKCNRSATSDTFYRTSSNPSENVLPNLTFNSFFNHDVNLNHSAVFIPVNIFDRDTSILCFAEWSNNLTENFKSDWHQLVEQYVSFIYIGDSSGAMRIYPASDRSILGIDCCNCPYDYVDTFDPRDRPWYINSIQGDKYVVILIDHSGSMTGSSSTRARLSSIELISDLNANDYFLVYLVYDMNTVVVSSYENGNEFLRASPENKLEIIKLMSELGEPKGKADFTHGLDMSLSLLKNSSGCHRLIMVFSDGRATFPVEEFTERNKNEVIVFSFIVDVYGDEDDLKALACNNNGTFEYLSSLNQIDLSVKVLTNELNRRTLTTENTSLSLYTDALLNSLIVTFSIPAKPFVNNDTQFTGVLAVDVTENLIQQIIIKAKLGSIGYAMLVTNNGQLYAHPLMRSNTLNFDTNLPTFDFSQYEFIHDQSVAEDIRVSIVDGNTGQRESLSFVSVEHKKRYIFSNFTYYYLPMEDDTRLAVKLPSTWTNRLNYSTSLNLTILAELKEMLDDSNRDHVIIITGLKPFCFGQVWYTLNEPQDAMKFLSMTIEEVLLNNNTSSASCNPALYEQLLRDLSNVYQITRESSLSDHIVSTFFRFSSGLLYCVYGNADASFNCNDFNSVNFIALAEENSETILSHRGTEGSPLFDTVQLYRLLTIESFPQISLGVVGVALEASYIDNLIFAQLNDSDTIIYLVDKGGYVLGSSHEGSNTSSFLGTIQPGLFSQLINSSVFIKRVVTGYHKRLCSSTITTGGEGLGSAGTRLTGVVIIFMNMIWHFLSSVLMVTFHSAFYYCAYGQEVFPVDFGADVVIQDSLEMCVSDVTFYSFNDTLLSNGDFLGYIECDDGQMMSFSVSSPPNISLIAITYKNMTECRLLSDDVTIEFGETETRDYPNLQYRSPSAQDCPTHNDYADAEACSGAGSNSYWWNWTSFNFLAIILIIIQYIL